MTKQSPFSGAGDCFAALAITGAGRSPLMTECLLAIFGIFLDLRTERRELFSIGGKLLFASPPFSSPHDGP